MPHHNLSYFFFHSSFFKRNTRNCNKIITGFFFFWEAVCPVTGYQWCQDVRTWTTFCWLKWAKCLCACMLSRFSHVWLFATPWTLRLLCPWDSPGKNTGVGCYALLQGTFQTQGTEPESLTTPALAGGSLPLVYLGSPKWANGERQILDGVSSVWSLFFKLILWKWRVEW